MIKAFTYTPKDVCSTKIILSVDDYIIKDIQVIGGCPGNLLAIRSLIIGMNIDDVITKFKGLKCPGSLTGETSCPDQISKALEVYKKEILNK